MKIYLNNEGVVVDNQKCQFKKLEKHIIVVNSFGGENYVESVYDGFDEVRKSVIDRWSDCMKTTYTDPDAAIVVYDLSKGFYIASKLEDLPGYEEGPEMDMYCSCVWDEIGNGYIAIPEGRHEFYFESTSKDLGL